MPSNVEPYKITLDIKRNILQTLVMKCGDSDSRQIDITITDNGKKLDISNKNIKLRWRKPDNTSVFMDCELINNYSVKVTCSEQMLSVSGISVADIDLYESAPSALLSTMQFKVSIKERAVSDDVIESSDEFSALTKLVTENGQIQEDLEALESSIKTAEIERVGNEDIRKSNEVARETAEDSRQANTATAITGANNAATNAASATQSADNATEAAEIATSNANTATQQANTAIETMRSLIASENVVHTDDKGVPGGVATLDDNGNVPASQLPGFVDDVLDGTYDAENDQFIDLDGNTYTPESGKIYVDIAKRITYRWSGTTYVDIGSSLALGTTASTAFPGNRGLTLEEKVAIIESYHKNIPASDIKFNNANTPLLGANIQTAIENLTQTASTSRDGLLSSTDKALIDNYADIQQIEVTLSASSWVGTSAPYTQIVTVTDLISYNNCSIELSPAATPNQLTAIADAKISAINYDETTGLTFTANGIKPNVDIPIVLCVATSMNVVEVPKFIGEVNKASSVSYDNTVSKMASTNVQDAINELLNAPFGGTFTGNIDEINSKIYSNKTYWVRAANASGTQPGFNYYVLIIYSNYSHSFGGSILIQQAIAFDVNGRSSVRYRMYANNQWYPWNTGLGGVDISSIGDGTVTGAINTLNSNLITHKTGGDHDGRYYTETEIDSKLAGKSNTNHAHPYLPLSGGTMTGDIVCINGGRLAMDGNTYISGWGWVTNLLDGKISTSATCNRNWNWAGQGGQPTWVWGGEDGMNMYVYNPANFSVNYATNAANATNATAATRLLSYPSKNYYAAPNDSYFGMWLNSTFGASSGSHSLGSSSNKWKQLYATTSTISTSDRNMKKNIEVLDECFTKFFMLLQPVSFLFKDGSSGRTHVGFISQDVESAMSECGMTDLDFAGFCKDIKVSTHLEKDDEGNDIEVEEPILDEAGKPTYIYSLRYEEFIAINTFMIQRLYSKIDDVEKRLFKLETI